MDWLIAYAEQVVRADYGDRVSVLAKSKSLNKFGRSANVDNGVATTVAQFPGTVVNETFVSTNIIDSIVSSNAGDTQTVTIEGHTIDASGNLTFVSQSATLNGQTEVALATPMARANRLFIANSGTFNSPQSVFAGNVSVYDNTDGITNGVPNTAAAVKLYVTAGQTQSQKAATSISSTDYWFITELEVSVTGGGPNSEVEFRLERRDVANGGVWRPFASELSLNQTLTAFQIEARPLFIVPPNHDVRLIATANADNTEVTGDIQGVLAKVIG